MGPGHLDLIGSASFRAIALRTFKMAVVVTLFTLLLGYPVAYLPIKAGKRVGASHVRIFKDGVRFLLIIFKIGTLYSPLKLFAPVVLAQVALGLGYYVYTYLVFGRLSLATIFLLTSAVTTFLIGLVSEQITQLMYRPLNDRHENE